jgi:gamma-glutamyltranspeptidase/glutathione hydrolase
MGQILGIYERILAEQGQVVQAETPFVDFHAMVEAMKHAFADRGEWLGDPAFADVPVDQLLSDAYLDDRAERFNPLRTRSPRDYGTRVTSDDSGTSHFCVVDAAGNAVACTETINTTFGSKLAVPEYGFCLNNEMDDFTTIPGQANAYGLIQSARNEPAPGKRPLSSMSPTIVLDGRGNVRIVAGAAGGPRIITSTLQIILYSMFEGGLPSHVMQMPRFHHQWQPDELRVESGFPRGLIDELVAKGHEVRLGGSIGNTNLIRRAPNGRGWNAAGDPRKGGRPAGH